MYSVCWVLQGQYFLCKLENMCWGSTSIADTSNTDLATLLPKDLLKREKQLSSVGYAGLSRITIEDIFALWKITNRSTEPTSSSEDDLPFHGKPYDMLKYLTEFIITYISTSSFLLEKRSRSLNERDCNQKIRKISIVR
jgi:hypothetical protein